MRIEFLVLEIGERKNPAWFSHVARAHRWVAPLTNSRPPMAARCEALPGPPKRRTGYDRYDTIYNIVAIWYGVSFIL
eukprot:scaffold35214_cov129-Isochrysis_galbana.AAC.3